MALRRHIYFLILLAALVAFRSLTLRSAAKSIRLSQASYSPAKSQASDSNSLIELEEDDDESDRKSKGKNSIAGFHLHTSCYRRYLLLPAYCNRSGLSSKVSLLYPTDLLSVIRVFRI